MRSEWECISFVLKLAFGAAKTKIIRRKIKRWKKFQVLKRCLFSSKGLIHCNLWLNISSKTWFWIPIRIGIRIREAWIQIWTQRIWFRNTRPFNILLTPQRGPRGHSCEDSRDGIHAAQARQVPGGSLPAVRHDRQEQQRRGKDGIQKLFRFFKS